MKEKYFDFAYIRQLINKFYEGTITPREQDLLLTTASEIKGSPPFSLPEEAADLAVDLEMLAALHDFSESGFGGADIPVPDDLDSRLERHIDRLALQERMSARRSVWGKVAKWTTAAAVAGGIIFAGYHYSVLNDSSSKQDSVLLIAKVTDKEDNGQNNSVFRATTQIQTPSQMEMTYPGEKSKSSSAASEAAMIKARAETKNANPTIQEIQQPELPSTETATSELEAMEAYYPVNDEYFEIEKVTDLTASVNKSVKPQREEFAATAFSNVNPEKTLRLPMSVFNAGVENVFESVSMLSETLSMAFSAPDTDNKPNEQRSNVSTQPI
ncbi:MAG: hypothetical protein K2J82_05030 [Muribaculaceae bacterium]|nr:hypothetical protein [Muribaculaceae bacterium]MDE6753960.1 hypothetical protein [Muribaculaceae bacterium]